MPADPSIRIGLLRLTDAAPVILAQAAGLFAAEGVSVELMVEPSWANLADKLAYGLLDAAVMLPPLALAMGLGLRPVSAPLIVPMGISQNGNAVTLANALAAPILAAGRPPVRVAGQRLAGLMADGRPIRLAVVHAWSGHDLLLRYWLAACGIDPRHEVTWSVVPPADMVDALGNGRIDGFCAGAPWGAVAAEAGIGRSIALSSSIWRNHPEKCLAMRRDWADAHQDATQAVLRAILRAAARCAEPGLADLLAQPAYVNVPAPLIAASLPGGAGGEVDRSVFAPEQAGYPWPAQGQWFLDQMRRWRDLPPELDAAVVYRPDLYALAARALGLVLPDALLPAVLFDEM